MPDFETIVPVAEEELNVSTQSVVTGRIRIAVKTNVIDELVKVPLKTTDVDVERVPIGRDVDEAPPVQTVGEVTIVPIMEEVLVIEKRLVLKEELHIKRRVSIETVETKMPVRKQQAVVDRDSVDAATNEVTSND